MVDEIERSEFSEEIASGQVEFQYGTVVPPNDKKSFSGRMDAEIRGPPQNLASKYTNSLAGVQIELLHIVRKRTRHEKCPSHRVNKHSTRPVEAAVVRDEGAEELTGFSGVLENPIARISSRGKLRYEK